MTKEAEKLASRMYRNPPITPLPAPPPARYPRSKPSERLKQWSKRSRDAAARRVEAAVGMARRMEGRVCRD